MLGGSPISQKSKKQPSVALSSGEAEYRSMCVGAKLSWLTRLLSELQVPSILPIPIKCDSLVAIYIGKNPIFQERTKHIKLDCLFVREKLHEGLISLSHTRTTEQLADLFTKPLPGLHHNHLLGKLRVSSCPPSNLWGGVGLNELVDKVSQSQLELSLVVRQLTFCYHLLQVVVIRAQMVWELLSSIYT